MSELSRFERRAERLGFEHRLRPSTLFQYILPYDPLWCRFISSPHMSLARKKVCHPEKISVPEDLHLTRKRTSLVYHSALLQTSDFCTTRYPRWKSVWFILQGPGYQDKSLHWDIDILLWSPVCVLFIDELPRFGRRNVPGSTLPSGPGVETQPLKTITSTQENFLPTNPSTITYINRKETRDTSRNIS